MSYAVRIDGEYAKTKKQVREAIKDRPEEVLFINTSPYASGPSTIVAANITKQRIDFVGPDPYANRSFYGAVTRNVKGTLCVE